MVMGIITKWLSRKVIVTILTGIVEISIATGSIPAELKPLLMKLVAGAGTFYVLIEGLADVISRLKKEN